MEKLLIKWLDKLIYGWNDTMPCKRKDDPEAWDSMQEELNELNKLKLWTNDISEIKKTLEENNKVLELVYTNLNQSDLRTILFIQIKENNEKIKAYESA